MKWGVTPGAVLVAFCLLGTAAPFLSCLNGSFQWGTPLLCPGFYENCILLRDPGLFSSFSVPHSLFDQGRRDARRYSIVPKTGTHMVSFRPLMALETLFHLRFRSLYFVPALFAPISISSPMSTFIFAHGASVLPLSSAPRLCVCVRMRVVAVVI